MRRFRSIRSVCVTAVVAVAAALGLSAPAQAAGQTPGTYTNYDFPSRTTALTEATWGTTVEADPGRGNVYWAHQFDFTNSVGGHVGQQRRRTGTGMLDAQGGASADGTKLISYTCSGGSNQRWTTPS
ncbi:hypothetical protein [Streptomyces sp. NPDC059262]|uniref:hypothetical protein n=1 Tax=Streptomyces sp. NPDC059262 TaxID=3346797 RepID=UPI0036C5D107